MDRVKNKDEVFTLKYFCEFINSLEFDEVTVVDPHSSVSRALLNNLIVYTNGSYIFDTISVIEEEITNGSSSIASYTNYRQK